MAEYWVAEYNTTVDGPVEAGVTYTMVTPRFTTFGVNQNNPGQLFTSHTNQSGSKTPDSLFGVSVYDYWHSGQVNRNLAVQMLDFETDDEGGTTITTSRSGTARGLHPAVENAEVIVFTGELTSIRPTPDRPSQWDTYHDPYIFTVPLSGESWTFSCNRSIDEGWIVLVLED